MLMDHRQATTRRQCLTSCLTVYDTETQSQFIIADSLRITSRDGADSGSFAGLGGQKGPEEGSNQNRFRLQRERVACKRDSISRSSRTSRPWRIQPDGRDCPKTSVRSRRNG
jgi:hypothetical protein